MQSSEQINNLNKPPKSKPLTVVQIKFKQEQVITRECGCGGLRPNCYTCYGSGYYKVDGFGNQL